MRTDSSLIHLRAKALSTTKADCVSLTRTTPKAKHPSSDSVQYFLNKNFFLLLSVSTSLINLEFRRWPAAQWPVRSFGWRDARRQRCSSRSWSVCSGRHSLSSTCCILSWCWKKARSTTTIGRSRRYQSTLRFTCSTGRILKTSTITQSNRILTRWDHTCSGWFITQFSDSQMTNSSWNFHFREQHIRTNLTWNNNGTITFYQKRIWHFEPDRSNGSLSDNITNLNPIAAVSWGQTKRPVYKFDEFFIIDCRLLIEIFQSSDENPDRLDDDIRSCTAHCYENCQGTAVRWIWRWAAWSGARESQSGYS